MTKLEYLSQIPSLEHRIEYQREHLHRLQLRAEVAAARWGVEPGGACSPEAPFVRILEDVESAREKLDEEYDLLSRLQDQVEEAIEEIPDERVRLFLRYRYIDEKKLVELEDLLCMSRSSVKRLRDLALDLFLLPEEPVSIYPYAY